MISKKNTLILLYLLSHVPNGFITGDNISSNTKESMVSFMELIKIAFFTVSTFFLYDYLGKESLLKKLQYFDGGFYNIRQLTLWTLIFFVACYIFFKIASIYPGDQYNVVKSILMPIPFLFMISFPFIMIWYAIKIIYYDCCIIFSAISSCFCKKQRLNSGNPKETD